MTVEAWTLRTKEDGLVAAAFPDPNALLGELARQHRIGIGDVEALMARHGMAVVRVRITEIEDAA